jgi:hypothetical protein
MNRPLILCLAMGAGLLGGLLSRCLTPGVALAQAGAPNEIRAHSFVLVDQSNNVAGIFKPEEQGPGRRQTIVLVDRNGKEVWRAGASMKVLGGK